MKPIILRLIIFAAGIFILIGSTFLYMFIDDLNTVAAIKLAIIFIVLPSFLLFKLRKH